MRMAKILDAKTLTADSTEVININLAENISAILIEAKALNSSNTPVAHPVAALTKIELLDGSRVLHSLSGYEAQMRQCYVLGKSPENVINYQNDVYCTAAIVIPFGRFLGDPKFGIDPARFKQLQLRITQDIGAGGSTNDALILDIDAYVFDEKAVSFEGYLCAKEYYKYSLVSSAIEDIDLPRDRKLRALYFQSLYAGKYPYEQYNSFKITEDNDRRIPYDLKTSHYLKWLGSMFGKFEEHLSFSVDTSGIAAPVLPAYEVLAEGIGQGGTALYFSQTAGNGGSVTLKGNAAGLFQGLVKGCAPHGGIILPFGDLNDPDDWYDLSKVGSLKAKITAGSSVGASSTCQIVTEQVEPY
jgi:hypothetical protein